MEINTPPAKSRELTPARFSALMMTTAATDRRKSSSAKPGPPWGNMEKSLCTTKVYRLSERRRHPNLSDVLLTLLRDTRFRCCPGTAGDPPRLPHAPGLTGQAGLREQAGLSEPARPTDAGGPPAVPVVAT